MGLPGNDIEVDSRFGTVPHRGSQNANDYWFPNKWIFGIIFGDRGSHWPGGLYNYRGSTAGSRVGATDCVLKAYQTPKHCTAVCNIQRQDLTTKVITVAPVLSFAATMTKQTVEYGLPCVCFAGALCGGTPAMSTRFPHWNEWEGCNFSCRADVGLNPCLSKLWANCA